MRHQTATNQHGKGIVNPPIAYSLPALLLCCATLLISGCRPATESTPSILVDWEVFPDSSIDGSIPVVVMLKDSLGHPLEGARVNVEATMTHPGMQPIFEQAHETAQGRYESALKLSMSGDWVLLLDIKLPDGQAIQMQKEMPGISIP